MDAYEATRIVYSRIQTVDPENAAKIMGLLLVQDHGEKEMIRLAFGPETLVHSVVLKSRKELGLVVTVSSTTSTPSSSSASRLSSGAVGFGSSSPSSWTSPPVFSRSNSAAAFFESSDELNGASSLFYNGLDQFQLQNQLSFLTDPCSNSNSGSNSLFYPDVDCRSPGSNSGESIMFPYLNWDIGAGGLNGVHRRSCSMADIYSSSDVAGFGWKPCLYFARGYCKNGSSCRFQHSLPEDATMTATATMTAGNNSAKIDALVEQQCHELLLRSKSQRLGNVASSQLFSSAATFPYATSSPVPSPTSSGKCINFLLQQHQQNETQRAAAAAAAAAMMLSGDDTHKLLGRSRMDRYDYTGLANPGSRQIYLTFPADSTFREEDVSNYFSIYGPVQDVRIPYQQKRMFGFVTFVYPDTVKLILAKGNPHFVCDARVLVKPYKEKGKLPDKKLQQQQVERGDFSGCSTPTGVDSRDPFDQLPQLGGRMLYGNSSQEMLLRRKLEEQQQATELQQAIEMQGRRFMGLQLVDLKNRKIAPVITGEEDDNEQQQMMSNKSATARPAAEAAGRGREGNLVSDDGNFHQSTEDHNLPDSPFASPTKSASTAGTSFSMDSGTINDNNINNLLDIGSVKSCYFPMPRMNSSSGHGAVGL